MINVERKNSFQLRISRRLKEETSHNLDIYLFVPGDLGLSTQLISEEAFYHAAIFAKPAAKTSLTWLAGRSWSAGLGLSM